jgi:DNA-binding MarR family transcriptional regulator
MNEPDRTSPERGSEPRWLDHEEFGVWLNLSGLMFRLPSVLDAQLQRDAGLSFIEYLVLAMLSESPRRTRRMSELAALTGTSLSRLSHLVSRLERSGYVSRAPDPTDGRFTLAILDDDGYAKVVESAPHHVAHVRKLVFDQLSRAQVAALSTALGSIFSRVDPGGSAQVEQRLRADLP